MKTEREIAELIFDKFRVSNCRAGQIVMMKTIRFTVLDKLNPKEKDLFFIVFNGLIFTGYFTYEKDSPECVKLTEKGYDYIYDDEKVNEMLKKPWIIPAVENTDWETTYNKLWKHIGPKETSTHYVGGSDFYNSFLEFSDDVPPSYSLYIEQRRKKELPTSRVIYYKELLELLDEEKRFEFYVKLQLFIEDSVSSRKEAKGDDIFEQIFNLPHTIISKDETVTSQKSEVISDKEAEQIKPTVFISYSWDNKEHEEWVVNLAIKLCDNGVDVILDKWDLERLGSPIPHFMENAISKSDRVICVMTPNYKKKTDNLSGGVGYEYSIISAEIFSTINTSKFIPLFRSGTEENAIPTVLKGRKYVNMRDDDLFDDKLYEELLRDIHKEPKYKKPPIGKKPLFN